jgi:hypothetical protein
VLRQALSADESRERSLPAGLAQLGLDRLNGEARANEKAYMARYGGSQRWKQDSFAPLSLGEVRTQEAAPNVVHAMQRALPRQGLRIGARHNKPLCNHLLASTHESACARSHDYINVVIASVGGERRTILPHCRLIQGSSLAVPTSTGTLNLSSSQAADY